MKWQQAFLFLFFGSSGMNSLMDIIPHATCSSPGSSSDKVDLICPLRDAIGNWQQSFLPSYILNFSGGTGTDKPN